MKTNNTINIDFLRILLDIKKRQTNPFQICKNKEINNKVKDFYSPFGFYEDQFEKEVRCPICLGRVGNASKPSSCIHIFCSLCIKDWLKLSNKCPVCRTKIDELSKVDINEDWVFDQGDLFIH